MSQVPLEPSEWLAPFVEHLLCCPSLRDASKRRGVVECLPFDLGQDVPDQNETSHQVAVKALAGACVRYEGGVVALLVVLRDADEGTIGLQVLEAFLSRQPIPPPSAFPPPTPVEPSRTVNTGGVMYNEGTINNSGGVNISGGQVGKVEYNDNRVTNTVRRNCPQPLSQPDKFAGRDEELTVLKGQLKQNEVVALTAVNGLGGIGKTALARQLAYDLYQEAAPDRYFRAVLWLDVTRLPDESRLLEQLARQVEPDFSRRKGEAVADLGQRVRECLQSAIEGECAQCHPHNRVLFVLDDVWENGVEIVARLKELHPANTTVLVTTRFGKVAHEMYVEPTTLNRFKPSEGAKMLAAYLLGLAETDLHRLCEVLGGHALALKLAAYRVPRLNRARALQTQTEQYRTTLAGGNLFGDLKLADKQTDLEKVLSYTYRDLDETRQARFRALGALVADQPFDNRLLAGLWGLAEDETEAAVEEFYALALLEPLAEDESGTGNGSGWYRQHLLLHAYALALLKADPTEQVAIRDRYHDRSTEIARAFLELQDKPEEWGFLTPYLPHIHATGDALNALTLSGLPAPDEPTLRRASDFASNITNYLFWRREVHKLEWLEMGLRTARVLKEQGRERLFLNQLGMFHHGRGERAKALEYYEQVLLLDKELNDSRGEANTLHTMGGIYSYLGENGRALELYRQALPLFRQAGDIAGEAGTCFNIGIVYYRTGRLRKAVEWVARCVELDEAAQHPHLFSYQTTLKRLRAELGQGKHPHKWWKFHRRG